MKLHKYLQSISFVTAGVLLGKLAGFFKHFLIAKYFGVGIEADSFFIANSVTEMAINVIISGLLTGAFIPVAGEVLAKKGEERFSEFISSAFYVLGFLLILVSAAIFLFSSLFADLIASGYTAEQKLIVARMLRIIAPGLFFIALASVSRGVMHVLDQFLIPSLGLVVANGTIILFTIFFSSELGIYAPVYGTTAGLFLWFLIHLPSVSPHLRLIVKTDGFLKKLLVLSLPAVAVLILSNIVLIIEKAIASSFQQGTITQLNLAFRLANIFSSLLIIPLGTVLLPQLSKKFGEQDFDAIRSVIRRALRFIQYLVFPFLVFVIMNNDLLVKLIYGNIEMSQWASTRISLYLIIYSFAVGNLFFYIILSRVYYSIQKTVHLVAANGIGVITYLMIAWGAHGYFESISLPMAYIGYALGTVVYLVFPLRHAIIKQTPLGINWAGLGAIYLGTVLLFYVRYRFDLLNTGFIFPFMGSLILIGGYFIAFWRKMASQLTLVS